MAASVTPLLGAVDVWALARSTRPLDVAAVGLGAVIFSLVYWAFGFLRMSVAGLTAQAAGAGNGREERASLARGLAMGLAIGGGLALLQWPIGWAAFQMLAAGSTASADTFGAAQTYFSIRIWGAPFVIASYAAFGWLTAKGRTDALMGVSLTITMLNILLDYWFVIEWRLGAAGVAWGTLIAEVAGFFIAGAVVLRLLAREGGIKAHWDRIHYLEPAMLARTLGVNRDIFIRTALLAICFAAFTQRGGLFGDVTLAANQVLLQFFLFTGLALDGTAIAAETLIGRAIGDVDTSRRLEKIRAAVIATFAPAMIAAAGFSALYAFAGPALLSLLTPDGAIRDAAAQYLPWAAISPLIVVVGFQLDGIFIGATRARAMRDGMILSAAVYLPALWLASAYLGNHGLWAAFMAFFALRALTLALYLRGGLAWLIDG